MLPDRVSNPGPLTYDSGALLIALRGPAQIGSNLYYDDFSTKGIFGKQTLNAHFASHSFLFTLVFDFLFKE